MEARETRRDWPVNGMSILSNDIFPCFQTITSPDAFFTQVSHRALFAPYECRISDVFVQRLRLATAFYEKRYSEISEICGEYTKVLADAPVPDLRMQKDIP